MGEDGVIPGIDTSKPHPARVYDFLLGGKDNFAADRMVAERLAQAWPTVRQTARENRAFIRRAIKYLTVEEGVAQFLDIGSGLPTVGNVHEVAQAVNPAARVVYVDNDPIVLAHARVLLNSHPEGRTAYIDADLRDPAGILFDPEVSNTLNLGQPVALMLVAILHFLTDEDDPAGIVATLLGALPAGSYLVASHVTPEHDPEGVGGLVRAYRQGGVPARVRTSDEFADLAFGGLEMIDPGLVLVSEWRPDGRGPRPLPSEVSWYGGIGRKS